MICPRRLLLHLLEYTLNTCLSPYPSEEYLSYPSACAVLYCAQLTLPYLIYLLILRVAR